MGIVYENKKTDGNGNGRSNGTATCTAFADSAEEPVKLTGLFISHSLTKSVNDMQWLQEIEEKAGVEVEWEQIYTDWDQTKSTRFASGDIPDILINATADSDYATYKGLFMELTDLIDQYAPNVQAMFEEEPDTLSLAKTYEGEIYALPKFQASGRIVMVLCSLTRLGWTT